MNILKNPELSAGLWLFSITFFLQVLIQDTPLSAIQKAFVATIAAAIGYCFVHFFVVRRRCKKRKGLYVATYNENSTLCSVISIDYDEDNKKNTCVIYDYERDLAGVWYSLMTEIRSEYIMPDHKTRSFSLISNDTGEESCVVIFEDYNASSKNVNYTRYDKLGIRQGKLSQLKQNDLCKAFKEATEKVRDNKRALKPIIKVILQDVAGFIEIPINLFEDFSNKHHQNKKLKTKKK